MAWTDPSTGPFTDTAAGRRNQVRIRVGDVDSGRELIQDEAVDHFLDGNGDDIVRSVIDVARAILARFATRPDSERVGQVWHSWRDLRARLTAIIAEYTEALSTGALPYAGGISEDDIDAYDDDTDIPEPVFHEDLARRAGTGPLGPRGEDEDET